MLCKPLFHKLNFKNRSYNPLETIQTFNGYKVKYRKMFLEEVDRKESKHVYNGVDLQIDHSFG
jgi:hypothetical protein